MTASRLALRFDPRVVLGAASLSVCLLGAAGAASAEEPAAAPRVVVHYADLNVNTPAGARQLYKRIVVAAHQVCPAADTRDLPALDAEHRCRAQAIDHAVQEVHSTQLAALSQASPIG